MLTSVFVLCGRACLAPQHLDCSSAHCSAFTASCSTLIVQLGVPLNTCRTMHLQRGPHRDGL